VTDLRDLVQNGNAAKPKQPLDLKARLALSPDEAAEVLGVSRDYLDQWIGPELRWVRRGRRKLVAVTELQAWLSRSGSLTLEQDR
jgi:excisionase family DNA binding protein